MTKKQAVAIIEKQAKKFLKRKRAQELLERRKDYTKNMHYVIKKSKTIFIDTKKS